MNDCGASIGIWYFNTNVGEKERKRDDYYYYSVHERDSVIPCSLMHTNNINDTQRKNIGLWCVI